MHILLIFVIIFSNVTLFCSDERTGEIPPRLGEIPKEKSKSHDSLSRKPDASKKVRIVTKTETQGRIKVMSKTVSSEDLTARIQTVTHQRSTATKSSTNVHFNDEPDIFFCKNTPVSIKQVAIKEQKSTAEQIKRVEKEIAEQSENRRKFFKNHQDIFATIEAGLEKLRAEDKLKADS